MDHGQCDLDHLLKFVTDPSKLEGTLEVQPFESVKGVSADAFEAFLIGRDVQQQAIDREALDKLCKEIIHAPLEPHKRVVAKGTPAVNGKSTTYAITDELAAQIDEVRHRLEDLEENDASQAPPEAHHDEGQSGDGESVSYYDQMSFVVVHKGDMIATKTERSLGSDGSDVYGKVIPAHEGKTNEGVLDDSIIIASDGTCTAAISGVLTTENSRISISSELTIQDDVDFKTGRIIFPGTVSVHGAVRDRFSVRADDCIEVRGLVQASDLESKTDITLSRGMAGKDNGTIKAGKDLHAGYLEAVHAEVMGDAIIKSEITNSELTIYGMLQAEHAALRGGHAQASKGASIGAVGSIQGVETVLKIGSLPVAESNIREIDGFLERLETKIQSNTSKMEAISAVIAKATPSQIEEQMGMQFEIDELKLRSTQLSKARKGLVEIMSKNTHPRLDVHKAIYAKVVLFLPGYRVEFSTDLVGESVIELGDTGHPSITYRGQTVGLSEHARVMSDDTILRVSETESEASATLAA